MTIAFDGDENSISDTLERRFCLLGEVETKAFLGLDLRADLVLFWFMEIAKGSGLES
tara:strand:+ start:58366 stop:58536 length:171 start_codon:yes stop_codon:yes gene_type:complete